MLGGVSAIPRWTVVNQSRAQQHGNPVPKSISSLHLILVRLIEHHDVKIVSTWLMAVAVVLSEAGNHVEEMSGGAAITVTPVMPLRMEQI